MRRNLRVSLSVLSFLLFSAHQSLATWQTTTSLPYDYVLSKAASNGSFLYKIAGIHGTDGICRGTEVLFAGINSDGTVGSWNITTPLPSLTTETIPGFTTTTGGTCSVLTPGFGHEAVLTNGYIYVLAGINYNFNVFSDGQYLHTSSAVYYAQVQSDGSLGTWNAGPYLPAPVMHAGAAVFNGVIYVTGGWDSFAASTLANVYYSKLNPDGTMDPWQTGAPLPFNMYAHAATASNGNLYISGGAVGTGGNQISNIVYHAPINADGSIGSWIADSPLPVAVVSHRMEARHSTVYAMGGWTGESVTASVYSASINSDGSLQNWTQADSLPHPLTYSASAVGSDTLYALSGTDLETPQRGVYYLPDIIPPGMVSDLQVQSLGSASLQLTWTTSGNDGYQGSVQNGQHDIRYSINLGDFTSFNAIPNQILLPADFDPGQAESYGVTGLSSATTYYFGLREADRSGNFSPISNIASAKTFYVTTSTEIPWRFKIESPLGMSVQIVPPQQSALLLQSAPGTSVSSIYQINPTGVPLNPYGIITFSYDSSLDPATLAIYKFIDSGIGWSSAPITSQAVDTANHIVSGHILSASMYALFARKKAGTPIAFNLSVNPKTVNLQSHGKYMTAYFEGADASSFVKDIDAKSLRITGINQNPISPIYAANKKASIGDANANGIEDLAVKFDRAEVQLVLTLGITNIRIEGALKNHKTFTSEAAIRVISPKSEKQRYSSASYRNTPNLLSELLMPECFRKWLKLVRLGNHKDSNNDAPSIIKNKGRKIQGPEKIALHIPDEAIASETVITVSKGIGGSFDDTLARKEAAERKKLIQISEPVRFGPEGARFTKPVTMELPYDRISLPAHVAEKVLGIQYWNPNRGEWEALESSVDTQAQIVRAQTDHFSLYQVMASALTPSAGAALAFGDVYSFPNPARPGQNPTIHVEAGSADRLELRFYDSAGALVHSAALDGSGTFEYAWDVSGVGSGVYVYVVTASQQGAGRITKKGRLAVIR